MTLENARVLYKHRLSLGKTVDNILNLYPCLADEDKVKEKPKEIKKHGKRPKRRATKRIHSDV